MKIAAVVTVALLAAAVCYAEEQVAVLVSDLIIQQPPVPSKIDPKIMVLQPDKMRCPADYNEIIDYPQHGSIYQCGRNFFVNYGNAVFLLSSWEEAKRFAFRR